MNDQATQSLIGRTVGGDPASLDELSSWVSDTLQPIVADVGVQLNDLIDELPEIWSDRNAAYFLAMLRQGRNDSNKLADRLGSVGELIGGTGPAIRTAQSRLDEVVTAAEGLDLDITEEGIWSYYDLSKWQPYDPGIVAEWHELCDRADTALEPLATQTETMANSNIWTSVLFTSGSFVNESTKRLLDDYEKTHGSFLDRSPERPNASTFNFQRLGLLKRAIRVGGPLIDGLQAVNSLREGKRPDQVLIEFGVGAVAGSVSGFAAAATVSALVAGSVATVAAAGLITVGALVIAIFGPEAASDAYIRELPMDARERIVQSGGDRDYTESGTLDWKDGVYGP